MEGRGWRKLGKKKLVGNTEAAVRKAYA